MGQPQQPIPTEAQLAMTADELVAALKGDFRAETPMRHYFRVKAERGHYHHVWIVSGVIRYHGPTVGHDKPTIVITQPWSVASAIKKNYCRLGYPANWSERPPPYTSRFDPVVTISEQRLKVLLFDEFKAFHHYGKIRVPTLDPNLFHEIEFTQDGVAYRNPKLRRYDRAWTYPPHVVRDLLFRYRAKDVAPDPDGVVDLAADFA